VFAQTSQTGQRLYDGALSDCAGAIIYSRRRKAFLEVHWVAATDSRVSYRAVADLGVNAMDC
jgi:hypothetical protein